MTALLAGLAFGIVGSGHCAGMCGPLVVLANPAAEPGHRPSRAALSGHVALYHAGRAATYLVMGALIGTAGGLLTRAGLGPGLAIASGVLLIAQALMASRLVGAHLESQRLGAWVTRRLAEAGRWMRAHRLQGPFVFGAVNGLLPCGFVYAALTAAAGFGDPTPALAFMTGFALGTTPVLAAIAIAGGTLSRMVPLVLRRAAPVALGIVGVLLIMRGVNGPHAGHGSHGADVRVATPPAAASPHAGHQH